MFLCPNPLSYPWIWKSHVTTLVSLGKILFSGSFFSLDNSQSTALKNLLQAIDIFYAWTFVFHFMFFLGLYYYWESAIIDRTEKNNWRSSITALKNCCLIYLLFLFCFICHHHQHHHHGSHWTYLFIYLFIWSESCNVCKEYM